MRLQDLVRRAAQTLPDKTAVASVDGSLSYRQLDEYAERAAGALAQAGVGPGDRVVIWANRSPEVVAAMQGILRLGAVYVPVDTSSPTSRMEELARRCGAALVLVDGGAARGADRDRGPFHLDLDDALRADLADVGARATPPGSDDALAYILYTSGSTGAPKGVCISHRNALAFVEWAVGELSLTSNDRLSNHASFSFDLSVLDLYGAFAVGASVHLIPPALGLAPDLLSKYLLEQRITCWYSVPSALVQITRAGCWEQMQHRELRNVIFAGEPYPMDDLRTLAEGTEARLLNFYGPTETNVCSWHEVTKDDLLRDRPLPIGRPASGANLRVQGPDGEDAAPGEVGELVVAGPTVMLGYDGEQRVGGVYRTGDLVRVDEGGLFEFVGRRDHLVKVRGHRIAILEIEACVNAHDAVDDVVVVVSGESVAARLVCIVVTGREVNMLDLRRYVASRLPSYMIPDHFESVDALPRNMNGKLDREACSRFIEQSNQAEPSGSVVTERK